MVSKNINVISRKQHKTSFFKGKRLLKLSLPFINQSRFLIVSSSLKFISLGEVERMRTYLRRLVGKKGKVWSKDRTFILLHKKAKGARMGKGIGSPAGQCLLLRKGDCLFEVEGLFFDIFRLKRELPTLLNKFSFPCKLVQSIKKELSY